MLRKNMLLPLETVREACIRPTDRLGFAGLFAVARRQIALIALTFLACLALGATYLVVSPPRFTAAAQLLIDTRKQVFARQADQALDAYAVDSQAEVIKSEAVSRAVLNELNLVRDPEFSAESDSLFRNILQSVKSYLGVAATERQSAEDGTVRRALKRLGENLDVQRIGRTYVLRVTFRSLDRDKAAIIANAYCEAYIRDQLGANSEATKRASEWLEDGLAELRGQLMKADRAVQDYTTANNLLDAGSGRTLTEQQLGDLSAQLAQVRAQVADAKARLDRVLAIGDDGVIDPAVSDALNNQGANKIREEFVTVSRQEADLVTRYGPEHPGVGDLRKVKEQLRTAARDEFRRIADVYKNDYEVAKSRQELLEANLAKVKEAAVSGRQAGVKLRMLESSAQAYRKVYDQFLERFADSTQQQSVPRTEARIITYAGPGEKSEPRTIIVVTAMVALGSICGMGFALIRDNADSALRTHGDIEEGLGMPCLSIVPKLAQKDLKRCADRAIAYDRPAPSQTFPSNLAIECYAVRAPDSAFTEALRRIRVALDSKVVRGSGTVLGVVSALPGEGTSTVAINLAQALSGAGCPTILLDADLRQTSLTKRIVPDARSGLIDVVEHGAPISAQIWTDSTTNLNFLPTVFDVRTSDTLSHLTSPGMQDLLDRLRLEYQYVVIDLPPLAPAVDAVAISEFIDHFILVVEWGRTQPSTVQDALGAGADVLRSRLLGAVLNKADFAALKRNKAHRSSQYYDYYDVRQH